MKQKLLAYGISLFFLFLSSLLLSSIISGLYYYHILSSDLYQKIALSLALLLFLIAGILLGRRITKKALLHALAFVFPFIIIMLFDFTWPSLLAILAKSVAYCFGTIIGLNFKRSH